MLTLDMLTASGIMKSRLWYYLNKTSGEISRPTLDKRLRDQQWTYQQVIALKEAGIWIESPRTPISHDDISLLYADLRGGPIYVSDKRKKREKAAKRAIAEYGSKSI